MTHKSLFVLSLVKRNRFRAHAPRARARERKIERNGYANDNNNNSNNQKRMSMCQREQPKLCYSFFSELIPPAVKRSIGNHWINGKTKQAF